MAQITQVDRKIRMSKWDIAKFQLITYCYLGNIRMSEHDLDCLTLLALSGEQVLEDFCNLTRSKGIFSSNQSARNALSKAEKKGLIVKEGNNRKKISVNPLINIQSTGNVVLNFKIVHLEKQVELQES